MEEPGAGTCGGDKPVAVFEGYIRYGYGEIRLTAMPWYPTKTCPSFQDALAALRRALWRKRIIIMFGNHTVPARIIEFFINAVAAASIISYEKCESSHYGPFDNIALPREIEEKFKILRKTVYLEGLCQTCQTHTSLSECSD